MHTTESKTKTKMNEFGFWNEILSNKRDDNVNDLHTYLRLFHSVSMFVITLLLVLLLLLAVVVIHCCSLFIRNDFHFYPRKTLKTL